MIVASLLIEKGGDPFLKSSEGGETENDITRLLPIISDPKKGMDRSAFSLLKGMGGWECGARVCVCVNVCVCGREREFLLRMCVSYSSF